MVLTMGDFNTKLLFWRPSEAKAVGPFLFSPLAKSTIGETDETPLQVRRIRAEGRVTFSNRDLLLNLCSTTDTIVAQTFLDKPIHRKGTFIAHVHAAPTSQHVDHQTVKELDDTLITRADRRAIRDVRARTDVVLSATTHIVQEVHFDLHLLRKEAKREQATPRTV